MKITAGNIAARVDYRIPGKQYSLDAEGVTPFNEEKRSSYPFDSAELAPGESFDASGLDVVRVVEYTAYTGPEEQTVAP